MAHHDMTKPFVVVIAGARRSGSTWMYNAVRLLIEAAGKTYAVGGWNPRNFDGHKDSEVWIVKEHRYLGSLADIADLVFTSERDWDEVAESWERFKEYRPTEDQMLSWQFQLEKWQEHPKHVFCMEYATLRPHRKSHFLSIYSALQDQLGFALLPYQYNQAAKELAAIHPPAEGYDPKTFLFANHITS